MLYPELITYVQKARGMGVPDFEIRKALTDIKWETEDIEEAFLAIKARENTKTASARAAPGGAGPMTAPTASAGKTSSSTFSGEKKSLQPRQKTITAPAQLATSPPKEFYSARHGNGVLQHAFMPAARMPTHHKGTQGISFKVVGIIVGIVLLLAAAFIGGIYFSRFAL